MITIEERRELFIEEVLRLHAAGTLKHTIDPDGDISISYDNDGLLAYAQGMADMNDENCPLQQFVVRCQEKIGEVERDGPDSPYAQYKGSGVYVSPPKPARRGKQAVPARLLFWGLCAG